jgi:hypothetical protein
MCNPTQFKYLFTIYPTFHAILPVEIRDYFTSSTSTGVEGSVFLFVMLG